MRVALRQTKAGAPGDFGFPVEPRSGWIARAWLAALVEFVLLGQRQRYALILPPNEDPLAEFPRERPDVLIETELPAGPAPGDEPRPAPVVPVPPAGSPAGRPRGWFRPFWAGCAVGAMAAGWLATGWSQLAAPVGASVGVPSAGESGVAADARWPVASSTAPRPAILAAPDLAPPPALAVAAGAPLPPPARSVPSPVAPAAPREPREPARFEGSLAVDSTPARARVFLNGEPVGLTPMVMTSLPIGSRAIRVEADDHVSWWSVVQVVAHQETSVRVMLPPTESAVSASAP